MGKYKAITEIENSIVTVMKKLILFLFAIVKVDVAVFMLTDFLNQACLKFRDLPICQ